MARHLAKIACLLVAGSAGWAVLVNLADLFGGWVPPSAALVTTAFVFCALYFPLARPIADMVADRMVVLAHRGRHIRAGSGLDEIPISRPPAHPAAQRCQLCGGPGGPICDDCQQQMEQARRPSAPPRR